MTKNYPRREFLDQSFNGLTVLSFQKTDEEGYDVYNCICHCGTKCEARGKALRMNRLRTCGCNLDYEDLAGRKFNNLTVIRNTNIRRADRYLVACECSVEFEVNGTQLRNGYVRSCGCKRREGALGARFHENRMTDFSNVHADVLNKARGFVFKTYRSKLGKGLQDVTIIESARYYDIECGLSTAKEKELNQLLKFFGINEETFNSLVNRIVNKIKPQIIAIGMDANMSMSELIDTTIYNVLKKAATA